MDGAGQDGDLTAPFDEAPLPNHLAGGNHVLVSVSVHDDRCRNRIGSTAVFNQHRPADCATVIGDRHVSALNLLRLWVDGLGHAVCKRQMRFAIFSISTCDGLAARRMSDEQDDDKDTRVTTEHR